MVRDDQDHKGLEEANRAAKREGELFAKGVISIMSVLLVLLVAYVFHVTENHIAFFVSTGLSLVAYGGIVFESYGRLPTIASDLLIYIKHSTEFDQEQTLEETALTVEYFDHQIKSAGKCVLFVAPTAISVTMFSGDFTAIFVGIGYCVIVIVSIALTHFRIRHGYFGSNSLEAAELIEFIAEQEADGKPPQSKRVSLPLLARLQARVRAMETDATPEKA